MPQVNNQGKNAETTVKFFIFYEEFNETYSYTFAVSTSKLAASSICDYRSVTAVITAIAKLNTTKQKTSKNPKMTNK